MYTTAILSGLLGAVVSAFLALAVRWYLDTRALRSAERRVAYVHFITVSEVLAVESLLTKYVEALGIPDLVRQLKDPHGSFEASHKACVLLADSLLRPNEKEREAGRSVRIQPKQLRRILDGVQSTQLDADDLSKLPRATIEDALRLQSAQQQLLLAIDHWVDYVDTSRSDWISADVLHDQWLVLGRFLNCAHRLRKSMISAKVVSRNDSDALYARQVTELAQSAFTSTLNRPKIAAAEKHFTQSPTQ